jgi:hypothetical protein
MAKARQFSRWRRERRVFVDVRLLRTATSCGHTANSIYVRVSLGDLVAVDAVVVGPDTARMRWIQIFTRIKFGRLLVAR